MALQTGSLYGRVLDLATQPLRGRLTCALVTPPGAPLAVAAPDVIVPVTLAADADSDGVFSFTLLRAAMFSGGEPRALVRGTGWELTCLLPIGAQRGVDGGTHAPSWSAPATVTISGRLSANAVVTLALLFPTRTPLVLAGGTVIDPRPIRGQADSGGNLTMTALSGSAPSVRPRLLIRTSTGVERVANLPTANMTWESLL